MTDPEAVADIARAAADLVPGLTERLTRLGLAEIEVRQGDIRVRVRAGDPADRDRAVDVTVRQAAPTGGPGSPQPAPHGAARTQAASPGSSREPVTSPAVGHFVYAEGLGPGQSVSVGVEIGFVEMLGIRHEVRAPVDGVVRHLVAESGEPVEFGQLLVEVDPTGPETGSETRSGTGSG